MIIDGKKEAAVLRDKIKKEIDNIIFESFELNDDQKLIILNELKSN